MDNPPSDSELKAVESALQDDWGARESFNRLRDRGCDESHLRALLAKVHRAAGRRPLPKAAVRNAGHRLKETAKLLKTLSGWDQARFLISNDDGSRRLAELSHELGGIAARVNDRASVSAQNKRVYLNRKKVDLVRYVKVSTQQLHDDEVSKLIEVLAGNSGYTLDAHIKWRKRSKELSGK